MFRHNRKKRILKNKKGINSPVKFFIFLPYHIAKYLTNEIISLIFDLINLSIYLAVNTYYFLNLSYQKAKAGLTLFISWAMKFWAVQLAVNFVKASAVLVERVLSGASIKFKSFVVNHVPIRGFVFIARVLPIGDWLKYEEQDEMFGHTSFSTAIENKDLILLDRILKVCSQEALYRYLLMKDCIDVGPLQNLIFLTENSADITSKILQAIKPEKRLWLLNQLTCDKDVFIFRLIRGKKSHCDAVLESLPKKDKIYFMNQITKESGSSPLILQALHAESWERITAFLDHYPKEHLVDYLNIQNERKMTFLIQSVLHSANNYTAKIIELVPEVERAAFLAKHHQGLKTLLYAKSFMDFYAHHHIAALEKYGIKMPEEYAHLSSKELKKQLPFIFKTLEAREEKSSVTQFAKLYPNENTVKENFKFKYGIYPLAALNIENDEVNINEIKIAYKKLMLFTHPDKNNGSKQSTEKSSLINEAYGVYTKAEIRKNYY